MKKNLLLTVSFLIPFFSSVIAQDLKNLNPFTPMDNYELAYRSQYVFERTIHYEFDEEALFRNQMESERKISFQVYTLNGLRNLELEKVSLLSSDYRLLTERGVAKSQAKKYKFYRGYVVGDPNSRVGLSIFKKNVHLIIYDQNGSFEISKVKDEKNVYAGFYSHEKLEKQDFFCATDTQIQEKSPVEHESGIRNESSFECVEIYIEVDYKSFQENGSNVPDVETWTLAIMAQVAMFYADSGIPIAVSGIKVYTSTDPYAVHGSTSNMLYAFRDSMNAQGYNGRLAHLFSGRGVGGGIAWLNVLCSNYLPYGVSGNLNSGQTTYSTYAWNIAVVAHELGHNFGSPHTHDCSWNGNNTQIDDCGNVYWYNKDNSYSTSCFDNDNRIMPGNQGTIMSYCHVVSGNSINLNLGFHPQVRDLIYDRYINSTCGGNEACVGVAPGNDLCEDAIRLTPTINCNPLEFDNEYATESAENPGISCGNPVNEEDVWFVVEIPSNGVLDIQTKQISGGLSDMILEVYTGTCGAFTSYDCDDNSGDSNHALVSINDISLANTDVYIRVVNKPGNDGVFGMCTNSSLLPCTSTVDSLISFYNKTGGAGWINKTGWQDGVNGSDCDYCNWFGISCDNSEKIIGINLASNGLSGNPSVSLVQFSEMETLDISGNDLSGSLLNIWDAFPDLKILNLSHNQFSGNLPNSLANLGSLESLDLSDNSLNGELLSELGSINSLEYIDLSNNDFEGCFPYNYYSFCWREYADLSGNVGLPNQGNFALLCDEGTGADYDQDGYCSNIEDCNDFDETIKPGAEELCDGKDNDCDGEVDEGNDHGPNVWIGPASGGAWENASNWSRGYVPKACEDVEIGMAGNSIIIDESGGQGNGINQMMRSICVGPNSELNFGDFCYIQITGGGNINNAGVFHMNGSFSIRNIENNKDGIYNSGTLDIGEYNYIYIKDSGINGIYNTATGVINNRGTIEIDSNHPINGNVGLKNENIMHNSGQIYIYGTLKNGELLLSPNSIFNNTGEYYIHLGSFQGGNQPKEGENIKLPPSLRNNLLSEIDH